MSLLLSSGEAPAFLGYSTLSYRAAIESVDLLKRERPTVSTYVRKALKKTGIHVF